MLSHLPDPKVLPLTPHTICCPNDQCVNRGLIGHGNIGIHSQKERRYCCHTCRATFAATTGTVYYRKQYHHTFITAVLTLLSLGCPLQAIVVALAVDEDTVRSWLMGAGQHCADVHAHLVEAGQVDTQHVQADELYVKGSGHKWWQAMAMDAVSRLWLGGVISPTRDLSLITHLIERVRASVTSYAVLVCVDGLPSYVKAVLQAFRHKIPRQGKPGRCRQEIAAGLQLGQVIKRHSGHRLVEVVRKVIRGTAAGIQAVLQATGTGRDIHTAYIERLNATFRNCSAWLTRKSRRPARTVELVIAGMWLVGTPYNFCTPHDSLRVPVAEDGPRRWQERTPAMAAGLTTRVWTMAELLSYRIPLPAYEPPKRKGRKPKAKTPTQSSGRRRVKT
jgi:transposase-like protein